MKTPASETFILALQVYMPPWLVRRGAKVSTPVSEEEDTVTPSNISFSCANITIASGSLSDGIKMAVQVTVSRLPALKSPVVVMFSTGSAGAVRERGESEDNISLITEATLSLTDDIDCCGGGDWLTGVQYILCLSECHSAGEVGVCCAEGREGEGGGDGGGWSSVRGLGDGGRDDGTSPRHYRVAIFVPPSEGEDNGPPVHSLVDHGRAQ